MPFKAASSNLLHFSDSAKPLGAFGTPSDGDALTWDTGTSTWVPGPTVSTGAAIDPASPYSLGAGVVTVTLSSSKTVQLRALSNYRDGEMLLFHNSSSGSITVTITPADGTIDGSASVALTVLAKGVVGCIRLTSSTWGSVQPGAVVPNAVYILTTGGAIVAYGGVVTQAGGFTVTSAPITLTAEDDTYGEVISGDTITVATAGLATGDTGAIQSNSRRYVVTLSALGISLTDTSPKNVNIKMLFDSITDIDARAGTLALVTWLGVSSTTALDIIGIQRPSTGTNTYQEVHAATSATGFTAGTANVANLGAMLSHHFPSDSGTLFFGALDVNGLPRATGAGSGGAISASNPDTIVVALRASAGASGAAFAGLRIVYQFGAALADL